MSTVGCSVPWGTQITKDCPPTALNTLYDTHDKGGGYTIFWQTLNF